jgi:hypothetical protein
MATPLFLGDKGTNSLHIVLEIYVEYSSNSAILSPTKNNWYRTPRYQNTPETKSKPPNNQAIKQTHRVSHRTASPSLQQPNFSTPPSYHRSVPPAIHLVTHLATCPETQPATHSTTPPATRPSSVLSCNPFSNPSSNPSNNALS